MTKPIYESVWVGVVNLVESVPGGSYPLVYIHNDMCSRGIIPAGQAESATRAQLDAMVSDDLIAGNSEPRYWQRGLVYTP